MATEFSLLKDSNKKCFVFILKLGQIIGLLPLEFLEDEYKSGVEFCWKSYKTIYSLMSLIVQGGMVAMCLRFGFTAGWQFRNIVRTLFYACNLWTMLDFFRLTLRLPKLLTKWFRVDDEMTSSYGKPQNIQKRVKIMTAIALTYAAGQVILFIVYNAFTAKMKAESKGKDYNLEHYFKAVFPQIFQSVSYSVWIGLFCQVHYIFTFLRQVYADLLVSFVSTLLSLRYRQVTARLSTGLLKKRSTTFWMDTRRDYDKICSLCRTIDSYMSNTFFVTFSSDLLLLFVYLYNCTIFEGVNIQKAYNVTAFIILLVRTLVMLLYVSWVNDESKEPIYILNSVSTSQYNSEIQRFLQQVNFDDVAFTANKMFKMSRSLITNVGGVILAYELILVQFLQFFP